MVSLKDVSLEYEIFLDRTNNLKEILINLFTGRKSHEQNKFHKALDGINLEFKEGERIGIIGSNGAGKSTILKVIAGIIKPTEGKLKVEAPVQPLIELGAGFDPEISGRENIYLNSYMLGFSKHEVESNEEKIIEFTNIGKYIDVPVKYYSSGMMVRLAFTIATTINPEILLIDEMLGAGDIHFIKKAEARIQELLGKAKLVIIVSHDLEFIKRTCSRTIVLEKGNVVFDGDTKQALHRFMNSEPPS